MSWWNSELAFETVKQVGIFGLGAYLLQRLVVHGIDRAAEEHRVRFSKLHDRRFEVIAKAYAMLVGAEQALKQAADLQLAAEEQGKRYGRFADKANEFYLHFAEHRIFFEESVCRSFDEFWNKLKEAGYVVADRLAPTERQGALERYGQLVGKELPIVKAALEAQCRRLLGVIDDATRARARRRRGFQRILRKLREGPE